MSIEQFAQTQESTFFSAPDETFFKTDHILGHKGNFIRYKKVAIALHPIRPPQIKAEFQQQKQHKVYKLMGTEQLFTV